ncbi:MAG TPA: phosphatase PAP2 family protein [Pedomonas sp.]|uniref:phosphatase PAP2 family protein n=1 Tax=Pedomonas sp. TaxID=2976421 RepID=UPI002F42559E
MEIAAGLTQASGTDTRWWRSALPPGERKRLTVLTAIVLTYAVLAQIIAFAVAGEIAMKLYALADHTLMVIGASLALIVTAHLCVTLLHTPWHAVPLHIWEDAKTHVLRRDRFLSLFVPLALLPLFIPAFLTLKSLIPDVYPFEFDATLHELDRWLHFGTDPWRITHAVFGGDTATFVLSLLYNLWFLLIWGAAFYAITRVDRPVERFQYLCAMLACWIINGTVLAYALSSAGPCYFGPLVGGGADPYQPLMEMLRAIDARLAAASDWKGVWALDTQQALLTLHGTSDALTLGGISAMPSMHVSLSLVMAMGMWRFSRPLGAVLWVYAAAILIGSIHLGWHYAADGYLSIITTVLIWKGIGWGIRRFGLDRTDSAAAETDTRLSFQT